MKAVTPLFFILSYLPLIAEPLVVGSYQVQRRGFYYYLPNQDSRFTGKAVSQYFNGQKSTESNYKDGMQVGLWTSWHFNGQKKEEGNFKDDKLDGLLTKWDKNGVKLSVINYKDGKKW